MRWGVLAISGRGLTAASSVLHRFESYPSNYFKSKHTISAAFFTLGVLSWFSTWFGLLAGLSRAADMPVYQLLIAFFFHVTQLRCNSIFLKGFSTLSAFYFYFYME